MKSQLRTIISNLPNKPGVYKLYSSDDYRVPIYIGKSVDIKKRILSHYYQAKHSARENKMMSQVTHIDYEETIGEIGALLREATLVKALKPIYNRRLRKVKRLFLYHIIEESGVLAPKLISYDASLVQFEGSTFGLYRSVTQAKNSLIDLCKNNFLCFKKMNLESGKGACFNFSLKKCKGICCGIEDNKTYNQRFLSAINDLKNYTWPYDGPYIIREKNNNDECIHVIDNWCYLGSYKNQEDYQLSLVSTVDQQFDIDHYKILTRYILKNNSESTKDKNE